MQVIPRPQLSVEVLEDRVTPSLTLSSYSGTLSISGTPASTAGVKVTETSQSAFQIMDGTKYEGTFSGISNINMNLASRTNTPVDFNFGTFSLGGNLLINIGASLQASAGTTGVGIANGTIGGNLTYTGGSGDEQVYLGGNHSSLPAGNLRIGGNVQFDPNANNNPAFANELLATAGNTVTIGGSVSTVNTTGVAFDAQSSIGRDISVVAGNQAALQVVELDGSIGRNVSVSGSSGGTFFEFTGATVNGTVSANLGSGSNTYNSDAATTIGGNATISGTGPDSMSIAGTYAGSLSLQMGGGANSIPLFTASVAGNLTLNEGNGNNAAFTLAGTVSGTESITQGNGMNGQVTVNSPPGGLFSYHGGNGTDSLDLEGPTGSAYNLNLFFGTGTNTLALDANDTVMTFSGIVTGSGGNNTLTQGADGNFTNITFNNFP